MSSRYNSDLTITRLSCTLKTPYTVGFHLAGKKKTVTNPNQFSVKPIQYGVRFIHFGVITIHFGVVVDWPLFRQSSIVTGLFKYFDSS